jgi:uncharacterized protein YqjF (DUF2071 family)
MHPALKQLDHRPWPIPTTRWTWRQNWYNLLFAHWPVPVKALRRLVPEELNIQEFGGTSWVGAVPFRMTGVMRSPFPDLPWVSAFPELNLRLYVERDGKPGIWFLSLDASNPLAVWAARRFFHLPYWWAKMEFVFKDDGAYELRSEYSGKNRNVKFKATYRPVSERYIAQPGSLEQFLVERYCLYAKSPAGSLYRAEVHHSPWPLQQAEGTVYADQLLEAQGLSTKGEIPLLHYSPGVETVTWSPVVLNQ